MHETPAPTARTNLLELRKQLRRNPLIFSGEDVNGFDLYRSDVSSVLDDEINFSQAFGVVVTQCKAVGVQLLRKQILQYATKIDFDVALQNIELNVLHACCGKQTRVAQEKLKEISLFA